MNELLAKIIDCKDEELDMIITDALNEVISSSKKEEMLGFCENMGKKIVHKGLIHPDTRIRYSNHSMNSYSMRTTDYYYEFARFIKNNNIKNKGSLIKYIEDFINIYFGINGNDRDLRDDFFDKIAWQTSKSDEEYFAKLDSLEIGNLKGQDVAMCTEIAAVAENLLSLFGIETYYCMGCINIGKREEPHCFNIVRAKEEFRILDYSVRCRVLKDGKVVSYAPFYGGISFQEIEDMLTNGMVKSFDNYEYEITSNGIKKVPIGNVRNYVVGVFRLDKNNQKNI